MTEQQYHDSKSLLMARLQCALKARCYRVARARIKELSRLAHQYTGANEHVLYTSLMKQYHLDTHF